MEEFTRALETVDALDAEDNVEGLFFQLPLQLAVGREIFHVPADEIKVGLGVLSCIVDHKLADVHPHTLTEAVVLGNEPDAPTSAAAQVEHRR